MDNDTPRSLLSINRSLMGKNPERKHKDKIVFRIWTKEKGQRAFQSEASTLNFFHRKWPKNMCPYCETLFWNKDLKEKNNESWTFICPKCKSTLTVLNE